MKFLTYETFIKMHLFNLISQYGGKYECRASSKVGTVSHAAMLKIKGAPFVQKMEPMKVVAGKTMYVTCPVAGWPISSIAWEKGNDTTK